MQGEELTLAPSESKTVAIDLTAGFEGFKSGRLDIMLQVMSGDTLIAEERFQMKGPYQRPGQPAPGIESNKERPQP